MSNRPSCDEVRELMGELALDVAVGEERARALSHVAGCARCRRDLDELSEVADQLLLLVPPQEPPPGFESRVIERVAPAREPDARRKESFLSRWRAALVLAPVAAALAAVVAGVGVYRATADDRELGVLYRQTLEVADGKAFGALPLHRRDGTRGGHVFGYEGEPSWLFVLVSRGDGSGRFTVDLDTRRGTRVRLGSFEVKNGRGTFGVLLPVSLFDVARVRVVDAGGRAVLSAEAPPPPS